MNWKKILIFYWNKLIVINYFLSSIYNKNSFMLMLSTSYTRQHGSIISLDKPSITKVRSLIINLSSLMIFNIIQ